MNNLEYFLRPGSIAIIGASTNRGKIGFSILENLLKSGYQGEIYPINPHAGDILGIKAYPSITSIPDQVDVALITIPAAFVPEIAEECGKAGVKGLVVITSGFSEIGRTDLEMELIRRVRPYSTRILGPNVVGVLSNPHHMNASFAAFLPLPGKGTFLSQSGALLVAIASSTFTRGVGFSQLIPVGNMSDVCFSDLIAALDQDETTSCISIYLESMKDGRDFIDKCRKCRKPVIVLKAGVSKRGAGAAASHTGSLAGETKIYSAAFERAGVIQAADLNNLIDRTLALSLQPPMCGDHLVILSNGGGIGVLAADAAEKNGIPAEILPADIQAEIRKYIPEYGSATNPIDLTGVGNHKEYYQATRALISHPWVDGLVIMICEHKLLDPMDGATGAYQAIQELRDRQKPVTVSVIGGEQAKTATEFLIKNGIPTYNAPELAVNAMAALREFARSRQKIVLDPIRSIQADSRLARTIIAQVRQEGRLLLTEIESKQVFRAYHLPVNETSLSHTEDGAVEAAKQMGFPVAMKVVSPAIMHKTEAGGVVLNIKSERSARRAFHQILKNALKQTSESLVHGVSVQRMSPYGREVILGSVNDPTFGPTLMFGLGGIFVEAMKDVNFQLAPVTEQQAYNMLESIRGANLLTGLRGEAPRDRRALAEVICKYSRMVYDLADEISESDANPCIVYEDGKGIMIVDARIVLTKN